MILTKHILSVYNEIPGLPPFGQTTWQKTIVKYSQWEDSADRNSNNDGKTTIDKHISIIIPKNANTQGRKYISWEDFERLTADKNKYWTLKINNSIIGYGITPDITSSLTITTIQNQYKSCIVKAVEDLTNQPVLPHWEIIGV